MKINIREELNELDKDTFNEYDLLNSYDACTLSDADKVKLVKMIVDGEDAEYIGSFLSDKLTIDGECEDCLVDESLDEAKDTESSREKRRDKISGKYNATYTLTLKNQYNYTVIQYRIDPKNKTIEKGLFNWGDGKGSLFKNRKELQRHIDDLLSQGYKMIDSKEESMAKDLERASKKLKESVDTEKRYTYAELKDGDTRKDVYNKLKNDEDLVLLSSSRPIEDNEDYALASVIVFRGPYIRWTHHGRSAEKATQKGFDFLLDEIFDDDKYFVLTDNETYETRAMDYYDENRKELERSLNGETDESLKEDFDEPTTLHWDDELNGYIVPKDEWEDWD